MVLCTFVIPTITASYYIREFSVVHSNDVNVSLNS